MHVVLKPFIKLLLIVAAVLGVAKMAGIDVDSLLSSLTEKINELTSQDAAEDAATE